MQTGKPSKTARKVALNILSLGAVREVQGVLPPGIVDATAKLLVESGVVSERAVRFARSQTAVRIYRAFDWMMPGQFEAFAHRKAFCEEQVRQGISGGVGQVLVLGAGYDTLGWRLAPQFPGVTFFEIDHPGTACLKAEGIDAMGARPNLCLLAEDLGQRQLVDVLKADAVWDSAVPTVVVAEGLLMYLPPVSVERLLQQCAAATGPGSRIAFTYVGRRGGRPDAGNWTGLVLWMLRLSGEPWLWSISPGELGSFLNTNDWAVARDTVKPPSRYGVEFYEVAVKPARPASHPMPGAVGISDTPIPPTGRSRV